MGTWFEYVDVFEGLLFALAYQIVDDDQTGVDLEVLRRIVASNPEVSSSVAVLMRVMPKRHPDQFTPTRIAFLDQLAGLIEEAALRAGYDHAAAAKGYLKEVGLV